VRREGRAYINPVGQVSVLRHLQGAQNREVDMMSADHRKGFRGTEGRPSGDAGDRILA
jgi:hypothetical protein